MKSKSEPSQPDSNPGVQADLDLTHAVSSGSLEAWHEFIDRYSGLIYGVIRRHLFAADEDEVRSVYVDILKSLYEGDLSKYRGESLLSTWLIVTTRRRALDFYRKQHGRLRKPQSFNNLSEFDQRVLQLFFVERLPLEIVVHTLKWRGHFADAEQIVNSIQRIEHTMDRRYFDRLDNEHKAAEFGIDSVRMLKYIVQLRLEYEQKLNCNRPDSHLMEEEASKTTETIEELISSLPPQERKVLFLRFHHGWPAKKIADSLKLKNQRKSYALIDKVVRKLRKALLPDGDRAP
jgi:RNA polymerase sigma factor (sigma-70 family)